MSPKRIFLVTVAGAILLASVEEAITMKGSSAVSGRITWASGQPADQLQVRAYAVRPEGDVVLGEATTDVSGRYRIAFLPPGGALNMQIRVSGENAGELARSAVHFNAPLPVVINCVLP